MICTYFSFLEKHVLGCRIYQFGVFICSESIGEGGESLPVYLIALDSINYMAIPLFIGKSEI